MRDRYLAGFLVFSLIGIPAAPALGGQTMKYRSAVLKELAEAETRFDRSSGDQDLRKTYARLLFEAGDFWKAKEILAPLAEVRSKDIEVGKLAARLAYMTGDYESAARLYNRVLGLAEKGSPEFDSAAEGLALVYFQTHQYDTAKELPAVENLRSFLEMMRKFPGKPYGVEWENRDKTSTLAFEIKEQLPTVKVTVNGKDLEFILDTGGNLFYIDKGVAAECGLQKLVTQKAKYAYTGGQEVEEFLGRADSVRLGGVTLRNVPFTLAEWKSRGIRSDGVVATQALKEFLTTVDYANGRMIFRERGKHGLKQFQESLAGTDTVKVPFVLDGTHLMFARGSLNGAKGLTFLVDSGLAMPMPFVGMDGLIEDMRLELTKLEGTKFSSFDISSLGLGDLVLEKPTQGLTGVVIEENPYWRFGFIWDGLISHQFLKNFSSWTIDFDSMTYVFKR